MAAQLSLGDVSVDVVLKDIKNIHLSVHPPTGRVTISAPARMTLDTVRVFAISRLGWIRQQQRKLVGQERETPREYLDQESHFVWGQRYLMKVIEVESPPSVELSHRRIILQIRPGASQQRKRSVLEAWYRLQLRSAMPELLARWEPVMGVKVGRLFVQRMKTRWGSCNPATRSIRLNPDLARKPPNCLEYIVVHEMCHLLEPTHNGRFVALMDEFMPKWRSNRQSLDRLPVSHVDWNY